MGRRTGRSQPNNRPGRSTIHNRSWWTVAAPPPLYQSVSERFCEAVLQAKRANPSPHYLTYPPTKRHYFSLFSFPPPHLQSIFYFFQNKNKNKKRKSTEKRIRSSVSPRVDISPVESMGYTELDQLAINTIRVLAVSPQLPLSTILVPPAPANHRVCPAMRMIQSTSPTATTRRKIIHNE